MAAIPRALAAVFGGLLMLGATGIGASLLGDISGAPSGNTVQANTQNTATNTVSAGNVATPAPAAALPANVVLPAPAAADPPQPAAPQAAPADPIAAAPSTDREITVSDLLARNQRYERVNIRVNGKSVGAVSIDASNPSDSVSFRVRGGDTYELSGNDAVYIDGQLVGRSITGSGTFNAEDDRRQYGLWQKGRQENRLTLELRAE
jgi:hypothetical protein